MKKNMKTKSDEKFWDAIDKASEQVKQWPEWKRTGLIRNKNSNVIAEGLSPTKNKIPSSIEISKLSKKEIDALEANIRSVLAKPYADAIMNLIQKEHKT